MAKLNNYQKNLREIIETEIRKNTSSKYFPEPSFEEKHKKAYERFYSRYGLSFSAKKEDNERNIDFITRIDMLEEYYQVVLESKGNLKTNEFLRNKNKLKEEKVARILEEQEREINLIREADNKKKKILEQNLKNFHNILDQKRKEINNIPEDKDLIINADIAHPIYKDIENALVDFFLSYNRDSLDLMDQIYLKIYLETQVVPSYPNFFELQGDMRKEIIKSRLECLSNKIINFIL